MVVTAYSQNTETEDNSNKLVILWTSDNPELAKKMVFMYAYNSQISKRFDEITLIIWGPSAKLAAENEEIQKEIAQMKNVGVKIESCIKCAVLYGVDEKHRQLGYDVKGMGEPFTEFLKKKYTVLTF